MQFWRQQQRTYERAAEGKPPAKKSRSGGRVQETGQRQAAMKCLPAHVVERLPGCGKFAHISLSHVAWWHCWTACYERTPPLGLPADFRVMSKTKRWLGSNAEARR